MFDQEHELFRDAVRSFVERAIVPNADKWEQAGVVDKSMFRTAGEAGFLAMEIPESFGGGGVDDFRFNVVINEEIQRAGVMASGMCITLHNDVCLPYFTELADDDQKARWFPGLASGELMTAIAMTEPGAGSDLAGIKTTAISDGDSYVMNGSKTFITNGINSDVVIVAAKTDPSLSHRGISLLVITRFVVPSILAGNSPFGFQRHAADRATRIPDVAYPGVHRAGPHHALVTGRHPVVCIAGTAVR